MIEYVALFQQISKTEASYAFCWSNWTYIFTICMRLTSHFLFFLVIMRNVSYRVDVSASNHIKI